MDNKLITPEELKLGILVSPEQLDNIYNLYMIILYENDEAEKGTLVYINSFPDDDYDKWFEQPNPITPIYNNDTDDEENYVYDE